MILTTDLPNILYRGKVRETYDLGNDTLLMIATDRISAFDVVLPAGIPTKGLILSRMSGFWFGQTSHIAPNHFISLADEAEDLIAEMAVEALNHDKAVIVLSSDADFVQLLRNPNLRLHNLSQEILNEDVLE